MPETVVPTEDWVEMRCFIKYNLYYGQPKNIIVKALLENGWTREEVAKAFKELGKMKQYAPRKAPAAEPTGMEKLVPRTPAPAVKKPVKKLLEKVIPIPLPPRARK